MIISRKICKINNFIPVWLKTKVQLNPLNILSFEPIVSDTSSNPNP